MKTFLSAITVLVLLSCTPDQHKLVVQDGLQISNVTIITFDESGHLNPYQGTILIDSTKIVYAGQQVPTIIGQYRKLDGTGKFIIPGLIDSHVHLSNVAGMHTRLQRKYPELVDRYFDQLPKSFLYFGYTCLIDLNNYSPDRINNILKSELRPDIFTCGEQLQIMNGFMMEQEEYPPEMRYHLPFVHDHYNQHLHLPDSINLTSHSAATVVKNIVEEQNGICIKTLYEDASSGLRETWEKPSIRLLKDIANEAQALGVTTIIHAPSFEGHRVAVAAGIDVIAHAMWNWSADPDSIMNTVFSPAQTELLDNISATQMGYQPTYRAITSEVDALDTSFMTDRQLANVFPVAFLDWLKTEEGEWLVQRILNRPNYLKRTNPEFFAKVSRQFPSETAMRTSIYQVLTTRIDKVVQYLAAKHANLLFGTDFGVMNMPTSPPGYSGFLEMKHWLTAGVDLEQILKSATYNNAKTFKLDATMGIISPGKLANLILLNSDPLKNINAYDDIDKIILHGEVIPRQILSAQ